MKPQRCVLIASVIILCLGIPGQASQSLFVPTLPQTQNIDLKDTNFTPFPKTLDYAFPNGVKIKVHFDAQTLKNAGAGAFFAQDVLNAAVEAYQNITEFQGFSTAGYTFAMPNKNYAYDPDKTIDVFIGDSQEISKVSQAPSWMVFKDAPCFDTIHRSGAAYDAVILLPANYKDFIRGWEKINPSPLGTRNVEVDLRGTLIHEMLHVIIFYYNHNLNHDAETARDGKGKHPVDWYVEGLARYFETFAGARHDFFSQGFKQTLPNKIQFSRGGANYFMRYPDQPFTDLRYENALFWRFIDTRYGMSSIERLTRAFRGQDANDFRQALEKATGVPFEKLLKTFSIAVLFKDFELKEDAQYLKDIAKTHLIYKESLLWLTDGTGKNKPLGTVCRTDWIGQWESVTAKHGEMSVAGDSTPECDVSRWATDYYQIDIAADSKALPNFTVYQDEKEPRLSVQTVVRTKGGSLIILDVATELDQAVRDHGLASADIETVFLLVTNTSFSGPTRYEIAVFS